MKTFVKRLGTFCNNPLTTNQKFCFEWVFNANYKTWAKYNRAMFMMNYRAMNSFLQKSICQISQFFVFLIKGTCCTNYMYVMYWLTFLKISPELLISYFQQLRTYSFDALWLNVAWGTTSGPQVLNKIPMKNLNLI